MYDTKACKRLAAAIVKQAAVDAKNGNGYSADARLWLQSSDWCAYLLDNLDLRQQRVANWVDELKPIIQTALL